MPADSAAAVPAGTTLPGTPSPAVSTPLAALLDDLAAESNDLDELLEKAGPQALSRPTPAEGWTVADTVGHLWFFDREGRRAITDPDGFQAGLEALLADPDGYLDEHLVEIRRLGESTDPVVA